MTQEIHLLYVGDHIVGASVNEKSLWQIGQMVANDRAYREPPFGDRLNPRWRREHWIRFDRVRIERSPMDAISYAVPAPLDLSRPPKHAYDPTATPTYECRITNTLSSTLEEVGKNLRERIHV